MSLADDLRNKAHDAIKQKSSRKEIMDIASSRNISFNDAMQIWINKQK